MISEGSIFEWVDALQRLQRLFEANMIPVGLSRKIRVPWVVSDFPVGGVELTAAQEEILDYWVDAWNAGEPGVLNRNYDARILTLVGHASRTGAESNNLRLGWERAESVQAFLAKAGFPAERMGTIDSAGSERPVARIAPGENEEIAVNRRVEVLVDYRIPVAVPPPITKSRKWELRITNYKGSGLFVGGHVVDGELKAIRGVHSEVRAFRILFLSVYTSSFLPWSPTSTPTAPWHAFETDESVTWESFAEAFTTLGYVNVDAAKGGVRGGGIRFYGIPGASADFLEVHSQGAYLDFGFVFIGLELNFRWLSPD